MFVLLFVFSQVGCDWVEISQNHYRKEPVHKVVHFEHTTKSNNVYRNNSIPDNHWHRGVVDKVANVGSIRQVQYPSGKTSPEDNRFNNNFNEHKAAETKYHFISAKPFIQNLNTRDEDEEQNKVIRTTTANVDQITHSYSTPIKKLPNLMANHFNRSKIQRVEDNVPPNQKTQVQISSPPLKETNGKVTSDNNKFHTITKSGPHRLSHDDKELDTSKNTENRNSNFNVTKELITPRVKLIQRDDFGKENDLHEKASPSIIEYSDKINYKPYDISLRPHEEYFNSRNKFGNLASNKDISNSNIKESEPNELNQNSRTEITSTENKEGTISKAEDSMPKASNVTKGNKPNGIWKLMKLITDTIYKNTHRSFKGKIKYLESLKTTILSSIEEQVDLAWPDDEARGGRRARAAQARGHVELPSSESSLMTISFLTFAVFVIKLVLQVIHTYKNKAMMMTPALVAAVGRAAAAYRTPK